MFIAFLVVMLDAQSMAGVIPKAAAFVTDCKWEDANLGVSYFNGASPADSRHVRLAAEAWNDVPARFFLAPTTSSKDTKITVESIYNPDEPRIGITTVPRCLGTGMWSSSSRVRIQLNDYKLDGMSFDEKTTVAAHEFGHAVGLGESQVEYSVMWPALAGNYGKYRIFVPVVDDIRAASSLYGWAIELHFEAMAVSGSASASGLTTPIGLRVLSSASGTYAKVYTSTSLPSEGIAIMMAYVRPFTLYRFNIGWELGVNSGNPYASLELDNDGIKLVYSVGSSREVLALLRSSVQDTQSNLPYFLELVVELDDGDPNKAKATAYAFIGSMDTGNGGELFAGSFDTKADRVCTIGGLGWVTCKPNTSWLNPWGDAKSFEAAVWTDSSSNPASDYVVEHFWAQGKFLSGGGAGGCGGGNKPRPC